jgi:hypothetical protein
MDHFKEWQRFTIPARKSQPDQLKSFFQVMMYNRLMPAIEVTDLSKTFRTKHKAAGLGVSDSFIEKVR